MPGLENEMTSNNNGSRGAGETRDRKIKQDTRAWAKFTDINYTTSLRQIESPFAQGFLGERVSARHLINTLNDHPLIGANGGEVVLGPDGFYSEGSWSFNRVSDYIGLALCVDFLRLLKPIKPSEKPEVSSYSLKHTAEEFLGTYFPQVSHVSNGQLIWAAAALGLAMVEPEDGSPNLMIGVSEREHDYVQRMIRAGHVKPKADQHRPAGFTHLQKVLGQCAAGEPVLDRWVRPESTIEVHPFHNWLVQQASRNGVVGDLASDYVAGVRDGSHGIAREPQELLSILSEVSLSSEVFRAAMSAFNEWAEVAPQLMRESTSIRTAQLTSSEEDTPGYGAGAGSIELYTYLCPCGDGEVIEEHDNIPGFREHDVRIDCETCRETWRFVDGLPVSQWRLEPVPVLSPTGPSSDAS